MQACRKIFLGGTLDALRSGTVGALRTLSDFNGRENKNSGIVGALRKIAQREIAVLSLRYERYSGRATISIAAEQHNAFALSPKYRSEHR